MPSLSMTAWAICFEQPLTYAEGVRLQDALVAARSTGEIPDTVLFLEHTPVITMGVRSSARHILLSPESLAQQGIEVAKSSRGGDVTWHGPGQLVMYPIIRLGEQETDARGYLYNLEEIAIRTAADFGVTAFRRSGLTGAWTTRGKLAAIGIRLKRWVTFHGMSFNVSPDLSGFAAIVPCGLAGEPVASLKILCGNACPTLPTVRERLTAHFSAVCRRDIQRFPGDSPPPELVRLLGPYLY
ncbi:MAG: lipoyl(octanoyl) transferase LipB [Verrucomicrobia bacterium]|nr:lipoyl(octanoyl) transferase LipB [Verrucomicrobiota bacterium]